MSTTTAAYSDGSVAHLAVLSSKVMYMLWFSTLKNRSHLWAAALCVRGSYCPLMDGPLDYVKKLLTVDGHNAKTALVTVVVGGRSNHGIGSEVTLAKKGEESE